MNRFCILDCTLRDGGYINNWQFGKATINSIVKKLVQARIDIVECGFLRDIVYDENASVFSELNQITPIISPKDPEVLYVGMIAVGDIDPEKIKPYDGLSIDGIRVTFHQHEWNIAKSVTQQLMEKGYKVFVQPVGTTSYTDAELLQLIGEVNDLQPYAFYLVDTLGMMYRHDVLRFYYLIDENLDKDIVLGFHSHNNLQLSFGNATEMLRQSSKRRLIIDASVYGMGRGAGNLATELIAQYINNNIEQRYSIVPLLSIAEQHLMSIYAEHRWGYALPYFISATAQCHPNYASHLLKKETLSVESIQKLLSLLPADKRDLFHKDLIEQYYVDFQSSFVNDSAVVKSLAERMIGRKALILGPGSTIKSHIETIASYIAEYNPVVIAVNFVPDDIEADMLFVSNQKRFKELSGLDGLFDAVIATSNLSSELPPYVWQVNYASYLGEGDGADNAGSMLIRLLVRAGTKNFALAGFDGFGLDSAANYAVPSFKSALNKGDVDKKNERISRQLSLALASAEYEIITPTRYDL